MKKDHVLVPEPSSKFNKVKCHECEEEQIVYSHSSLHKLFVIRVEIFYQKQQVQLHR